MSGMQWAVGHAVGCGRCAVSGVGGDVVDVTM